MELKNNWEEAVKVNLNVLAQLTQTYGVSALAQYPDAKKVVASGNSEKAPAKYEPFLTGNGYVWDDSQNAYIMEDQSIYYFSNGNIFIWVWGNTLFRGIKGGEALNKWVQGNEKYPEGKANSFMGIYNQMTGQGKESGGGVAVAEPGAEEPGAEPGDDDDDDRLKGAGDITFAGAGVRGGNYEPKIIDPTDALINKLKKQAGFRKTLPTDLMIDLGLKAKKEGNQKLLNFLKTVTPLKENSIKKNDLSVLIQEIVRNIIQEVDVSSEDEGMAKNIARKVWGIDNRGWVNNRTSENGSVFQFRSAGPHKLLWKTPSGQWKYLDDTSGRRKWQDVPMTEENGTAAVSPVTTPMAFKKKPAEGLEPLGGMEEKLDEMTTTDGGTPGYNIPGAFSGRGGSKKGIAGSAALGYDLTVQGKKDMQLKADKLYESKDNNEELESGGYVPVAKIHSCKKDGHRWHHKNSTMKDGERIAIYKCSQCGKRSYSSDPNQP